MDSTEKTIDLKSIYLMLKKHLRFIIVVTVIFTIGAFIISEFIMSKKYTASVMLYVQSNEETQLQSSSSVDYSQLQASEKLANTCQVLFTSENMISRIIDDLKEDYGVTQYTSSDISEWVTVTAEEDTSILNVSVETENPDLSAAVAQSIDLNAHEVYSSIVDKGVVKEVVAATVPDSPSSPNVKKITAIGLLVGLVLSCGIAIVIEMLDTKIKPGDDLYAMYGIPVFAEIVDFEANVKGGYSYYEYKKH